MEGFQNLHAHTTYSDGSFSAEEMVNAAILLGGTSLGFSEHSYLPLDTQYWMTAENTPDYIKEVTELKILYEGKIDIFLGMEQDYFTEWMPDGLDYVIGTVHYIKHDGILIAVDENERTPMTAAREYFGGDFYSLAEAYFETAADLMNRTGADIIGHFDILMKHNKGGVLFDEFHPRYVNAALSAMDELLKKNRLFEINTGAMFRMGNTQPYPSEFLLKELFSRGGEILITCDSHSTKTIYYKFNEMIELAKFCGFKYIKRLTKTGFSDVKI
jgi:histidinol-phosphatase (PHP family)